MSQRKNHRRGEGRHQDNGPTWEGGPPNSGSNSTHVARSRSDWKRLTSRKERRTGSASYLFGAHRVRPSIEEDKD
jgi:hypothetical protein